MGLKKKNREILETITSFYLSKFNNDFNGIELKNLKLEHPQLKNTDLIELIKINKIEILWNTSKIINPYIKRDYIPSFAEQIGWINSPKFDTEISVIYPSKKHLIKKLRGMYKTAPYTRLLALGENQLLHKSFDLSVIENYKNDARYNYFSDEISGNISIKNKYYLSNETAKKDKICIQNFGYSYDENNKRQVTVALRYLSKLSDNHQQLWFTKQKRKTGKLHPIYESRNAGYWDSAITLTTACIKYIKLLSDISIDMGRAPLFKSILAPKNFMLLLRPTLLEYSSFILTLNKLLGDNIDKKFFKNDILNTTSQGTNKGSINMLDEWLKIHYDHMKVNKIISVLKDVNKERQKPAHINEEDCFDEKFIDKQREYLINVVEALKSLVSLLLPGLQSNTNLDTTVLSQVIFNY